MSRDLTIAKSGWLSKQSQVIGKPSKFLSNICWELLMKAHHIKSSTSIVCNYLFRGFPWVQVGQSVMLWAKLWQHVSTTSSQQGIISLRSAMITTSLCQSLPLSCDWSSCLCWRLRRKLCSPLSTCVWISGVWSSVCTFAYQPLFYCWLIAFSCSCVTARTNWTFPAVVAAHSTGFIVKLADFSS